MSGDDFIKPINWNKIEDEVDKDVWDRLVQNFWIPEKIALSNDLQSWGKLTDEERDLVLKVFVGLTSLDTLQGEVGAPSMLQDAVTQHEKAVYGNIAFMEAFSGETELLTPTGWKQIQYVTDSDEIAQYDPDNGLVSFVNPTIVPSHYATEVYEISVGDNKYARQVVSGGHRVYYKEKKNMGNVAHEWGTSVSDARDLRDAGINSGSPKMFVTSASGGAGAGIVRRDAELVAALYGESVDNRDAVIQLTVLEGRNHLPEWAKSNLTKEEGTRQWGLRNLTPEDAEEIEAATTSRLIDPALITRLNLKGKSEQWAKDLLRLWIYLDTGNDFDMEMNNSSIVVNAKSKEIADYLTAVGVLARVTVHSDGLDLDGTPRVRINTTSSVRTFGVSNYTNVEEVEDRIVYCVQVPTTFLVTRNGSTPVVSGNCVHAKSYSSIFQTLATSEQIEWAFRWAEGDDLLVKKSQIINKYYDGKDPLMRKAASVALESFLFYSGFFWPFYLSSRGLLTNTADIIRLILRDEAVHGYYIGYKLQIAAKNLTEDQREELQDNITSMILDLYELEEEYTERLYDPVGLTEKVKVYLRYNANKAMMNMGYPALFPEESTRVDPEILSQMSPDTSENHDFFSGSGSSYIMGKAEETSDDDWDF